MVERTAERWVDSKAGSLVALLVVSSAAPWVVQRVAHSVDPSAEKSVLRWADQSVE